MIKDRIDVINKIFEAVSVLQRAKEQECKRLFDKIDQLGSEQGLLEQCIEVFRTVANDRRKALKARLEKLLSYGLRVVFEESLELEVEYKKWGASDRVYLNVRDANVMTELTHYRGGGLVEIVSILIRLLILAMYKPNQRRFFMADEPFGGVSEDHLAALSKLLRELAEKLDMQMVVVTHSPGLYEFADKVYEVRKVNGQSQYILR